MEEKEMNQIEKLLDPNNTDNIVLFDDDGNTVEFEQIAVIPLNERVYVLLVPVAGIEDAEEDVAGVFLIDEDIDSGEPILSVVDDDDVIDAVFAEYEKLVEEDGE